jgi:glycosyltransferase involved in cell wall biosynthesis
MLLSLVVPCYNEEGNVTRFYSETERVFSGKVKNYEIVFVDDGSRDGTLGEIEALHESHATVRGVSFSRNFGKEAAMLAGLKAAKGDLVCIIDADLQQRPEIVLDMLSEMERILSSTALRPIRRSAMRANSSASSSPPSTSS